MSFYTIRIIDKEGNTVAVVITSSIGLNENISIKRDSKGQVFSVKYADENGNSYSVFTTMKGSKLEPYVDKIEIITSDLV